MFRLVLVLAFFSYNLSSLFAMPNTQWIDSQIEEDLGYIPDYSLDRIEVVKYFHDLKRENSFLVEIKKGKAKVSPFDTITGPFPIEYVNTVSAFFKRFCGKYRLPDLTFLLVNMDGFRSCDNCKTKFPVFVYSKSDGIKNACLFPDRDLIFSTSPKNFIDWNNMMANDNPWETKTSIAFFRGGSTGGAQRIIAAYISAEHLDLIDAGIVYFCGHTNRIDVDNLVKLGRYVPRVPPSEHYKYKYLLDIEGWLAGYERGRLALVSNSTLLKVNSSYRMWYDKALIPNVHFVPIKADLSDLVEKVIYLGENDAIAKQIAEEGRKLGQELFSEEGVDEYIYRLLTAYAKKFKSSSPETYRNVKAL